MYVGVLVCRRFVIVGIGMVVMFSVSFFNWGGIGMIFSIVMGDVVFVVLYCGSYFVGLCFYGWVYIDWCKCWLCVVKYEYDD